MMEMECGSAANGPLAEGCEHCRRGGKMVLFITGKCGSGCYYCPVSFEKKELDVVYADELKVTELSQIADEAESVGATGTGITGGDPLRRMERTAEAIRMLKDRFGEGHHIHLYTSTLDPEKVRTLAEAGLDEIRFHPPEDMWARMGETRLAECAAAGIPAGVEVPALPGSEDALCSLVDYCMSVGVAFVNLNELEFSESNWSMMEEHGYEVADELSSAVLGSRETAMEVMRRRPDAPLHFCSSSFKDGVQLRNRLLRRAERTAEEYDVVTEDGTLLRGLAYPDDLGEAMRLLSEKYDVPDVLMRADPERRRLIVAPWVLEELADELPFACYISEVYPTADGLEVERAPLNRGGRDGA